MMNKSDYWVWYYDDNGDLHRDIISALSPDDAKDIFILSGGNPDKIDRIEHK